MFGGNWLTTRIFDAGDLKSGDRFDGPVVVDTGLSTVVVPPSTRLIVDDNGLMRIKLGMEGAA